MPINVANLLDADKRTAVAGEAITMGMVIKLSDDGAGRRKALKLADSDAAVAAKPGTYGIAYKLSTDSNQVNSSTAPSSLGDRTVSISSGDLIIELRRGAIVEYSADLLHSSLDPSRSGTTPQAGTDLNVKGSQWCATSGVAGSMSGTVIGRVFRVFGTKVLVELL